MFKKLFTKKDKRTNLEKEIDSVLEVMSLTSPASSDYDYMAKNLEILCKAKDHKVEHKIDWAPFIAVGGNILIAVLVLAFEKEDTITTKVSNFIFKGRV